MPYISGIVFRERYVNTAYILPNKPVFNAQVVPTDGRCYVPYGGAEHGRTQYQVLTNPGGSYLDWVSASYGEVPKDAIQGGEQTDGQKLYIGRAYYNGSMIVGKVHSGHKCLYVSFEGKEVPIHDYEVLVSRNVSLIVSWLILTKLSTF